MDNPGASGTTAVRLSYRLSPVAAPDKAVMARGIVKGVDELSALYTYVLQVESPGRGCAADARSWLGQRVVLQVERRDTVLGAVLPVRTVCGMVMEVASGPVELYEDSAQGWYELTIQPEFARACYSRNRAVYTCRQAGSFREDCPEPEYSGKVEPYKVLEGLVERWAGAGGCVVSEKARKRIPLYMQLVQNDESDYNFFCRLLATWGLCYRWELNDAGDHEVLHVYDALEADTLIGTDAALPCMTRRGNDRTSWRRRYGLHNLPPEEVQVQNYAGAFSSGDGGGQNRVRLSLHDETWDQLEQAADAASRYGALHYMARHFNASSVHGMYRYVCAEADARAGAGLQEVGALRPGDKVTWAQDAGLDKADYFLTRREIKADAFSWAEEFSGREAAAVDTGDGQALVGCGVLPLPVEPCDSPDLDEAGGLLRLRPWDEPRPRTFMAVVVSNVPHRLNGRNLCRVRELNGEEMWVEMGSPSADSNSGILARPRVDNVLFCVDRGNLGIPIAVSAMFRGKSDQADDATNCAPLTELKVMDRIKREMKAGTQDDNSSLTLRSRTHVPERTYEDSTVAPAADKGIAVDDLQFVQRPQSVDDLAKSPKPFSQIQMLSLDNGVKPIPQDKGISKAYMVDAIAETTLGLVAEADFSAGYSGCDVASALQEDMNRPVSRPHLQGISMYSSGDLLTQSADHQIMNAGGEIVLTAAQAITLRVGKSYVRISESGVEVSSGVGMVDNPGAYPAYHAQADAQNARVSEARSGMMLGGHIMVNAAGVYNKGPYVANTAVNMFTAGTILGSAFTLSDFSSRLYAPSVTIVGGAAIENTLMMGAVYGAFSAPDVTTAMKPAPVYSHGLRDGFKKQHPDATAIVSGLGGLTAKVIKFAGGMTRLVSNLKNLVSVEGSMVKLLPDRMTVSARSSYRYTCDETEYSSPVSGFIATAENALASPVLASLTSPIGFAMVAGGPFLAAEYLYFDMCGQNAPDDTDTYTGNTALPDDLAVPDFAPSFSGAVLAGAIGLLGSGIGAIVCLALGISNPAELVAKYLFLGRNEHVLGMKGEAQLAKMVTEVKEQGAAVSEGKDVVQACFNKGVDEKNVVQEVQNAVQRSDRAASRAEQVASLTKQVATLNEQVAALERTLGNMNQKAALVNEVDGAKMEN